MANAPRQKDDRIFQNNRCITNMTKVVDWNVLKSSLGSGWRTVLQKKVDEEKNQYASPKKPEYWDRDVKKLKRIISEP